MTSGPSFSQNVREHFLKNHLSRRNDYLQLSPAIQKLISIVPYYYYLFIQALMFLAIGLLVPQPCLIFGLLRRQRKLPYWCTKVCYSHQLKPNLAYSPQGRLLRKRQDSVFERDYVSTSTRETHVRALVL